MSFPRPLIVTNRGPGSSSISSRCEQEIQALSITPSSSPSLPSLHSPSCIMTNNSSSSTAKKEIYPKFCAYGDEIKYSTSKSDDNAGRRYKACPNYKDQQNRGCGYFRWLDKFTKESSNNQAIPDGLVEVVKLGMRGLLLLELVLVVMGVIAVILAAGLGLFGKKKVMLALP